MKKKLLFIIILMFLFIYKVNAEVAQINCDKTEVKVNEEFTCSVTTNVKTTISTSLEVTNGNKEMTSDGKITFKATASGSYTIAIKTDDYEKTDAAKIAVVDNTTKSTSKSTTKLTSSSTSKAKSSNTYLTYIKVNKEDIKDFKKDKYEYELTVDDTVESVIFDSKAEDEKSNVSLDGTTTLKTGKNVFNIKVTAEDNSTKIYKITIIKKEKEKKNTNIKKIKIEGYNFSFDGNSKTGYLTIKEDVNKLNIKLTLEDESSKYEIEGNNNLKDGSIIKITVKASDNTKSTYRIIIEKKKQEEKKNNIIVIIVISSLIVLLLGIVIIVKIKNKPKRRKENNENDLDNTKTYYNLEESSDEKVDNDEIEKTLLINSKVKDSFNDTNSYYNDDFFE